MSLFGVIRDINGSTANIDSITNSLLSIDYEHHEIHEGDHFYIEDYMSFTNGQVIDFTVITPNTTKWAHMIFSTSGSYSVSIAVHEGATVNVTGTTLTSYNNNRNYSATASTLVTRYGDTFTATGTNIGRSYAGANKDAGTISRSREIVLKQNTTYIFRITNESTSTNIISYSAEWYEHTNL